MFKHLRLIHSLVVHFIPVDILSLSMNSFKQNGILIKHLTKALADIEKNVVFLGMSYVVFF